MDYPVYKYALCVSLTLMIFFACNFIFGRLPTKETFKVFRKSRILMGSALLVLSANYSIHFFFTPRQSDVYLTIFLNLSTFFLAIWLICGSLLLLIDHACLTRRRIVLNLVAWIMYSLLFWFIGSSLEFWQTAADSPYGDVGSFHIVLHLQGDSSAKGIPSYPPQSRRLLC